MDGDKKLIEWIRRKADGSGQSWNQVSLRAGLKPGWVSSVVGRGVSARPDALAAFCRAVNESPLEAFRVAGWLTDDEVEGKVASRNITDEEWALVQALRSVPPDPRQELLESFLGVAETVARAAR